MDIHNILTPKKFIPVWLERKNLDNVALNKLPPISIELHLTSLCNFACYHCSYANRRQSLDYLEHKTIESLINNIIKVYQPQSVYFSGGGEPTTLKYWDSYVNKFVKNNTEVALITNGSLIRDTNLNTVSKLNYIALSLYSTKKEVSKQITGSKFFEHSFVLPQKIKSLSNKTLVGARCVINKYNFSEILDIYNAALDSSYDYIIFIPEIDYENRGIKLNLDQVESMINLVNSSYIDSKKTNLKTLTENKFNYYSHKNNYNVHNINHCQAVKLRTNAFINFDGGVYLCQPHIDNNEFCIGNILNNNFSEIWNSEQHIKVINKLNHEWNNNKCKYCRAISYNKVVQEYIDCFFNTPFEIVKDPFL